MGTACCARGSLGYCYYENKHLEEALQQFQRSIEINSEDALAWIGKGDVHFVGGDMENAKTAYEKALSIDEHSISALVGLGNVLSRQKEQQQAELKYRQALELDPSDAYINSNLGALLIAQNRSADAIPYLLAAVEARGDLPAARANLGNAYAHLARWDEAVLQFAQAVKLDPNDYSLVSVACLLYSQKGDQERYHEHCTKLLAQHAATQDPKAAQSVLVCLISDEPVGTPEQWDALLQVVNRAEAMLPYEATLRQGIVALRCGESDQALELFETAMGHTEIDGKQMLVAQAIGHALKAVALNKRGKTDAARTSLEKALHALEAYRKEKPHDLGERWPEFLHAEIAIREAQAGLEMRP